MRGLTAGYVLRRLGVFIITVWLGSTLIFIIPRLMPGDPVEAVLGRMMAQGARVENAAIIIEAWRKKFGLDRPILEQYLDYLKNTATFDLNYSLAFFPERVSDMIGRSLPWTIGLLAVATVISFVLGNVVGALLGWRRTPNFVKNLLPVSLTFTSVPFFMFGMLLIYIFAYGLRWFDPTGATAQGSQPELSLAYIWNVISHAILPAFAIVITSMGFWALGMRGMMVTNDGEDYLILAQAKGLRPRRIFLRYAVRNAILPQVTALALSLGAIVGGSILVEYIFAYPGMGYLLFQDGIINNDFTLIQGIVFVLILATSLAVLIIDLIYPLLDPRITYQKR
jgi:peptide/nickel transport system permease protein